MDSDVATGGPEKNLQATQNEVVIL